jgi:CO/xanthine dehydrogenase Mo-binding subunit
VVHAVLDALDVPHLEMPLTAERVWRALRRER